MFKFQRILLILFSFVLIKRTRNDCDKTRPIKIDFADVQLSTIKDFQVYFFKELLKSAEMLSKEGDQIENQIKEQDIPGKINDKTIINSLQLDDMTKYEGFFNTDMTDYDKYVESHKKNLIKCVLYYPAVVIYSESCKEFKYVNQSKLYLEINRKLRGEISKQVKGNFENTLISELSNNLKLENVDGEQLILDDYENNLRKNLYRASQFNFSCDKGICSNKIKNNSFISSSTSKKVVEQYAGSGSSKIKNIFHFTEGTGENDPKIKGKFIQNCSLQPSEAEFTIDKDQCWEITSVKKKSEEKELKDQDWSTFLNKQSLEFEFKLINCGTLNIVQHFII
jgi:hypothetical protein